MTELKKTLENIASGDMYNQETVNKAISAVCESLKDCTRAEALHVIESVRASMLALWEE